METQEDKEIRELLIEIGLATVNAQTLEGVIVSLFAAIEVQGGVSPGSATLRELMDTRYRQTLGRLVRDLGNQIGLEDQLSQELAHALERRNWFIHRSMREYHLSAFNAEMRGRFIEKIREARDLFEQVSTKLHTEAVSRLESTGLSQEELKLRIRRTTEAYIGRILQAEGQDTT